MKESLLETQPCKRCGTDVQTSFDCTGLPICSICGCYRASSQQAVLGMWEMQARCLSAAKNTVGAGKARKKATIVKAKIEKLEQDNE